LSNITKNQLKFVKAVAEYTIAICGLHYTNKIDDSTKTHVGLLITMNS